MLNLTAVFNVQINIALHGAIHSAAVYIGKRQGGINPVSYTHLPTGTYGYVAKTFVSLFGSLVVISAVAASISTASTSALGASAVANRDIYQRLINPKADAKKSLKMSKIIMQMCIRDRA